MAKSYLLRPFWLCLLAVVATYFYGAPIAVAQLGKQPFMGKEATTDDYVRGLKRSPPPPSDDLPKTRGLRPQHESSKAEGQQEMAKNPIVNVLITFEFNSAELTAEAKQQLDRIAEAMRHPDLSGDRFRLEGHTDASGSEQYNMTLSQRRAQAVRNYLMQRAQLESSVLESVGKGESELYDTTTPRAAINRRVTIINIGN